MKFSTANVKNGDYNEKHVIYIGTQTGSFKSKFHVFTKKILIVFNFASGIDVFNEENPYKQSNLQTLTNLTKESKVTALSWADEEKNEILLGRGDSVIRTFDCSLNSFCETDLNIPEGKVIGLAWCQE
jgi:hypothetical protein